ncbi:PREDICTED: CAAX prenyl protease 1 homolog [Drosophila arizonae]|uniref:CAAX prenyl protease n=1 Tax=Drosophila arizonae TaxID=7263 RepID=A0ABM1PCL1_DROAR|nr:PREDICTED: CAAX prenyl protease 1 homolog [Drosophila arizonae]
MIVQFWNDPAVILLCLMIILLVDNLWNLYLILREIKMVYGARHVPEVLRPYLSQELFERMRRYKLHKSWFIIVNTLIMVVICGCLELYFGFYGLLWDLVARCAIWSWMKHEIWMSFVYLIFLSLYILVKSLPGKIYEKCCIRKLVKQPKRSWSQRIAMELVDICCSLLLMATMVAVVVSMVNAFNQYAFVGIYLMAVLLTVIIILIIPIAIDPFVGQRVQLENQALKAGLEQLTRRVGFSMRYVQIIHVRDPNVGSNAFFFGSCCLKRIVIFDTLLLNRGLASDARLPPEERGKGLPNEHVLAVVAHELGHWKRGHFYKAIVMFQLHLLITLVLFVICYTHGPIYQAVGFDVGVQPVIVGFIVIFGFLLTPYLTISNVLMLTMTRQFEYEADKFAFQLGYAAHLRMALLKLYADNLTFPLSDTCYSSWHHTHPTMLHRLQRLERLESNGT